MDVDRPAERIWIWAGSLYFECAGLVVWISYGCGYLVDMNLGTHTRLQERNAGFVGWRNGWLDN